MSTKSDIDPKHLDTVIDNLLTRLDEIEPTDPEFDQITDQLQKLYGMRPKKDPYIKAETLIPVIGNLAGILAILNFERAGVITSKALSFVVKTRV